ncbi:hypothetical protein NOH45_002474 [Salmonella enterica]|nr:hypothetical protein [Salmonella enterica]
MRMGCYSWLRWLTVYYFCISIVLMSYPRRSGAVLPLAVPLVMAAVPAGTSSLSAISGVTLSYIAYTLGSTAVITTAAGLALEYNGRTSSSTSKNLRSEGVPVTASTMISMGITKPSDWDMPYNGGRLVNVTSPQQLASVAPGLVNSPLLYSPPSLLNPVPVYIPPQPVISYPTVPDGVKFSAYPSGVYNVKSSAVYDKVNPDKLPYISASDVNELADFILANSKTWVDEKYSKITEFFSRAGAHCSGMDYPDVIKEVESSSKTERYMINGSVKNLPLLSSIHIYIPPVYYVCFPDNGKTYHAYEASSVLFFNSVSPDSSFIDTSDTSQDKDNARLLPPLSQVSDVQDEFSRRPLTPAQISSFINTAWSAASSREGYKGIPYSSSIAVTPQLVKDIMDARGMSLSFSSLFEPVGKAGYWDIPVYNITLNQYVSITNIEADPVIDFGPNPGVTAPELAPADSFDKLFSPLFSVMPFMREIKLPYKPLVCPVFSYDIPYVNLKGDFNLHCVILSPHYSFISDVFTIFWTLISLFIILRRRG